MFGHVRVSASAWCCVGAREIESDALSAILCVLEGIALVRIRGGSAEAWCVWVF